MPATSKLFEYIRPLIAVSFTITFVIAAHTISFGALRSVPEMCKLHPVAFEFDFPEDQSAVISPHNGDPGILRWLYNDLGDFVGEKLGTDAVNWEGGGPFGGAHPGITVFVRCDGSVQSISNDIERDTLARLGHISDGQAINVE